eukprot:5382034-Pleurochrysis_carterae.AAC.1
MDLETFQFEEREEERLVNTGERCARLGVGELVEPLAKRVAHAHVVHEDPNLELVENLRSASGAVHRRPSTASRVHARQGACQR